MENIENRKKLLKKNKIITILGTIICIFLSIMLILNITIIIKGTIDSEKPPSIFGITPMVVLSGSMSGTQEGHIEVGDLIFTKNIEASELKEGDVITYMTGGTTVTHRITSVGTDDTGSLSFTTKGDANDSEDTTPVSENQLVGIYIGRLPKVGDFAMFLQKPLGMMFFIGVPLILFIIYDIIRRQKYANIERKRTQELEEEIARLQALERKNNDA